MPIDAKLIRNYFLAAAELPAAEQTAYLAANCADRELRAAVERLLVAHEQPASVLDRPVVERFELRDSSELELLSYTEDPRNFYRPDKTAAGFWKEYDAKKE